jgi:hypothetical protein
MESKFGLVNVWQGDFVTRAVAMLLLACRWPRGSSS